MSEQKGQFPKCQEHLNGHCKSVVLFNHLERGCEALEQEQPFVSHLYRTNKLMTNLLLTLHIIQTLNL